MSFREVSRRPEIKILFSATLLLIAGRFLNWRDLADAVLRLDAWHLGVALLGAFLVLLFSAVRWGLVRHVRNYLFGIFISILTPANIGADLYRFGSVRKPGNAWPVVSLLLQEKVFILLGYLVGLIIAVLAIAATGLALTRDQQLALTAIGLARPPSRMNCTAARPSAGACFPGGRRACSLAWLRWPRSGPPTGGWRWSALACSAYWPGFAR